jgi:hypothetical protein
MSVYSLKRPLPSGEKINNTFLTERGTVKRKQPKAIFEKIFLFRITPITDISECYRITPL